MIHSDIKCDSSGSAPKYRLALVMANTLDCESMAQQLSPLKEVELSLTSCDLDYAAACFERVRPDVLILDPRITNHTVEACKRLLDQQTIHNIILLDERVREGLVVKILPHAGISYLTRENQYEVLLSLIQRVILYEERVFDHALDNCLLRTARGYKLRHCSDRPSVAALTRREREVTELLAQGSSVRDCASQLRIAESTVDNHKSRIMKKLQVKKVVQLAHFAIRDGLVQV